VKEQTERAFPKISYQAAIHIVDKPLPKSNDVYVGEGVPEMPPEQQDRLQAILGDEKARVVVARDLGEKDFGNGGSVFVSVSLACDQDLNTVYQAAQLGYDIAGNLLNIFHPQMVQDLKQRGLR
jgi:hypothetical protein